MMVIHLNPMGQVVPSRDIPSAVQGGTLHELISGPQTSHRAPASDEFNMQLLGILLLFLFTALELKKCPSSDYVF